MRRLEGRDRRQEPAELKGSAPSSRRCATGPTSTPLTGRTRRVAELSGELDRLRGKLATDEAVSESLAEYADRLRAGERDQARAHISRAHRPASEDELRVSRVAEAWAAISVSLMLISFVGIAMFEREHLISMLVFSIAFFAFVEAGFRGRLVNLVSSANIGLAVVATLIIIYEFFWQLVVAAVLVVGLYVLWDNLRELRDKLCRARFELRLE